MSRIKASTNVARLLDESPISDYWIGFLAADGHFSNRLRRLSASVAIKDVEHLRQFANYIGSERVHRRRHVYAVAAMDSVVVPELCKRFGFTSRKSTEPPQLDWLPEPRFLSFLIGFIDGDGCIQKYRNSQRTRIKLLLHGSWLDSLKIMAERVAKFSGRESQTPKMSSRGYASWDICGQRTQQLLKNHAVRNSLPIMTRKWEKIQDGLETRTEAAKSREKEVLQLLLMGFKQKEIARYVGLTNAGVSNLVRRCGLKRKVEAEMERYSVVEERHV